MQQGSQMTVFKQQKEQFIFTCNKIKCILYLWISCTYINKMFVCESEILL